MTVSEGAVQASARELGGRLRRLRRSRSWSLDTLARASGLSKSFLSRLESGERQPGLPALVALASAYSVPIGVLFGEDVPGESTVIRGSEAAQVVRDGITFHELSPPTGDRDLHAMRATMQPDHQPTMFYEHVGEEWVHVLSGRLRLTVGAQVDVLEPGDSAQFESKVPHKLEPEGEAPVEVLVVVGRPASLLPSSYLRQVA